MANLNLNGNVSRHEEALVMAYKDMISFGKLFLPDDYLRSETPWFHYEIADKINNKDIKQLAVIMPRGHGKTVLTKADILRDMCFAKKAYEWGLSKVNEPLFYGWVSATAKLSVGNMDYVKSHIEMNEKINYYFGDLKGNKWTETDIEFSNGCKLISKSNISGIRGGAKLHKRYDLVVLDDFEDENNTITPESREKNSNLITAVVFPALEPHTGRMRINGTPVHFDSFINNLIVNYELSQKNQKEFSWDMCFYKALKNGQALWGSWFPIKELERKKKFYADSGQPHKFYQEYMMEVQSSEDSIFNMNHVKYWEGKYEWDEDLQTSFLVMDDGRKLNVNVFAGVDPATDSERRDADFSVVLTIAVDSNNNTYVLDYIHRRGLPVIGIPGEDKKGIVDYIFDINNTFHPNLFVIEDTTMSRPVFQSLITDMRRRNDFSVKFKEEKPGTRTSKRDRIQEVLVQRFAIGSMHIKKMHHELQHEILTFGPRMAHDDTIDALAYACKYAFPPNEMEEKDGVFKRKSRHNKPRSWVLA